MKPSCVSGLLRTSGTFAIGALSAVLVMQFGIPAQNDSIKPAPDLGALQGESGAASSGLKFYPSKAADALADLTPAETKAVAKWIQENGIDGKKIDPVRTLSSKYWIAGQQSISLILPPKSDVLSYIDGNGPLPPRFARVYVVGPEETMEYSVGPIVNGKLLTSTQVKTLLKQGTVPLAKRPQEVGIDDAFVEPLHNSVVQELGEKMMVGLWGPIYPQFKSYDKSAGTLTPALRNDVASNATNRINNNAMYWTPPPPELGGLKPESLWMYPVPFSYRIDTTSPYINQWYTFDFLLCHQGPFPSAKALREAFEAGSIKGCPMYYDMKGNWSVPQKTTPPDPAGLTPKQEYRGVSWGPWNFTVVQRPGTGVALHDVRFNGERILYELSFQEAHATYSGNRRTQHFYADAASSMSMASASLVPGVDCPKGATYLSATKWVFPAPNNGEKVDPTLSEDFWPICVFEFTEDHTIWRHMQNDDFSVTGKVRKTVVVRSVATSGNYDYLSAIAMREDGEIEVHTRFAGYAETRYYNKKVNPEEEQYSTILRPGVAGPVHSHLISWKADFDIGGARSNALKVTAVKTKPLEYELGASGDKDLVSKYIDHSIVDREGEGLSTFVANPKAPKVWSVVDQNSVSEVGNPRGYAVTLSHFATLQVLPDDHPFTRANPFTKYHLAVTKYHDDEYRVNSIYDVYDSWDIAPTQGLDRFLADNESLVDEDLVAWICIGKEHITRQEDVPLVSNFGSSFSLQPWNFHLGNAASNSPKY
eukprot:gnl/MRDRNA2_/MRDRNA2_80371_c0_seq4.p1 gnl/MRDRNA2_/MRDRNA2_80371_c0~~gnl/MRDRNA2_/MRDRNA2_80371_c0_seq4.p1  ORF type:complete len:807 (-),score=114.36 gnl/MRDRNA2_/MRDRNA2_80371_c0_seq4:401-2686(-)